MDNDPGMDWSPLSVNNLPDPGTTTRKLSESYAKNNQARFLIKALKDFILPIVHTQGSGWGTANRKTEANDDIDRADLGPKAQQLVDALENFISSLFSPEVIHNDGAHSEEVTDLRDNMGLISSFKPTVDKTQQSKSSISGSEAPPLLRLALETARYRIFNEMPIRLLAFKSDGSGIKLLDRNDTWDYVSPLIEARFNEDEVNKDVERWNHYPNAEMEAIIDYVVPYTKYAILSHTWLHGKAGEVTYSNWKEEFFDTDSPGYQKLSNFCRIAAIDHGHSFAWMDTICINKDSSSELDESIRSMYKWYSNASMCITYLAHTTTLAHMHEDAWFTRGWTLQELLAPRYMKFYSSDWQTLNSDSKDDKKNDLVQEQILKATTITPDELNSGEWPRISRRMQWAANRRVTREEDVAYSLMGIFDVSLSIAYGEGAERAFFRLAQQILNSKAAVQDIINWGYGSDITRAVDDGRISSLIPSRPRQYLWRSADIFEWPIPSIPVTLTHLGLHVSVLLMPAVSAGDPNIYLFPIGDYYANAALVQANNSPLSQRYNVLDMACQNNTTNTTVHRHRVTFGVLNFGTTEPSVYFQTTAGSRITCFAVALYFSNSDFSSLTEAVAAKAVQVIQNQTAITFDLLSHQFPAHLPTSFEIPKKDLAQHGMQLLDMYL